MDKIIELINRDDINKIAILPHVMPDGDTLGSSIALKLALKKIGKKAEIYFVDEIPSNMEFLSGLAEYAKSSKPLTDIDLAIAVDCSNIDRISDRLEVFESARITAVIDHHGTNELFGDYNFVDSNAAAAGEIIFTLLERMSIPLDKDIAIALYTACATDTGSFKSSSTTKKSFEIAGKLIDTGFNFQLAVNEIFHSFTIGRVEALKTGLNALQFYYNNKIAITYLTMNKIEELKLSQGDVEGISEYLRDIKGVEVSIFLRDLKDGKIKVSMRSKSYVNLAELVVKYGGGGHPRAAGFSSPDSADEIISNILQDIKEML